MDMERIQELLDLMKKHGLRVLEVEEAGVRYKFESECPQAPPAVQPVVVPPLVAPGPAPSPQPVAKAPESAAGDAHLKPIKSPMVGTFYRAPAPDADPFVRVGDHVTPDSVVCIIEAMKVMNEITSHVAGTIRRIVVKSEELVAVGQVLMWVEPH